MTLDVPRVGNETHVRSRRGYILDRFSTAALRVPTDFAVLLAAATLAVLALLVLPPIFVLVFGSLTNVTPAGAYAGLTLEHYAALLATPDFLRTTVTSVVFAGATTAISLLFGGTVAWIVERTDAPLKRLAYFTTIISLGTPYTLYVTAWLNILGRAGPFNSLYRSVTGHDDILLNVYSLWGMVLIEGFLWSPLVFLLLSATFRVANGEMEEAARMSGASVLQTVWRVSMPLAWPAILALALFVFIRNLEVFEVPALVGVPGGIRVFTTDIYYAFKQVPPQLGHASAFSVVLLGIVAGLLYYYSRVSRSANKYASLTGKGYRARPFQLGRWRWAAAGIVLLNFVIVLGLPLVSLLWTSLLPYAAPMRLSLIPHLTLANYTAVLTSPYYLEYAVNTVLAAAGAATAAMVIAVFVGWLAARRKPGGALADQLAMTSLIFPGIVLGVAMMQLALRLPVPLYGTLTLIALAFTIRYMPYGLRYAYSGVLQIHRELEEAAGVSGAGVPNTLRRIVVPLLAPAIISGWLFIFLIAAKELSIAILLAGPNSQMMAVVMFDLWTNGQGGELSALGLLWTALMAMAAALFYFLMRKRSAETFGV